MQSHDLPTPPRPSALPAACPTLALALGALALTLLTSVAWPPETAPFPFLWRDVALVQFLAALPIAALLAHFTHRRVSRFTAICLAAIILLASAYMWSITSTAEIANLSTSLLLTSGLLRALVAAGLATGALLSFLAAMHLPPSVARQNHQHTSAPISLFTLIVLFLVPAMYIRARCQYDASRVAGLLEQSRLGEALPLLQRLLVLSPREQSNGRPLHQQLAIITSTVREIESRVAMPLPGEATDDDRLARARDLAILGKTHDAQGLLQSSPTLAESADACNLLGTIHETRGEWEAGRRSYDRAKLALESQPPSPTRTASLIRATTGIAYCHRKLGHYAAAEAAYQHLLTLSPTADVHFLLAQFYDDTEQTAKAHAHAQQAATLDPSRYQRPASALLDKLASRHFSCFTVGHASDLP